MMKLLTSTLHHHLALMILLSVCLPLDINGWSFGLLHPNPNSMSSPLQAGWILPTPSRIQKKRSFTLDRNFPTNSESSSNGRLVSSPPLFEITDNDQEFQIAIDVPGMKREDINVDLLLDDVAVLSISGLRVHKQAGKQVEFSQSFSLDPAVVAVDKLTANLENGVLIVSAPKDDMKRKKLKDNIRQKIPIQVPADKDDNDNKNDAQDNKTMGGGSGAFDARNESNIRRPDLMEEEEEDLNAA